MRRGLRNVLSIYNWAKLPYGKVRSLKSQKLLALVLQTVALFCFVSFLWSACVGRTFLVQVTSGFIFSVVIMMTLSNILTYSLLETLDRCFNWCHQLHSHAADKWRIFEDVSRESEMQFRIFICYLSLATFSIGVLQITTRSIMRSRLSTLFESYFVFFYDETFWSSLLSVTTCLVSAVVWPIGRNLVTASLKIYLLHFIGVIKVVQRSIQTTFSSETLLQLKSKKTLRELVDLHCDMIRVQNVVIESFKVPILVLEAECYLLLIVLWIFTVLVPELWVLGVATQGNLIAFISICSYNEKLSDAYDDLREALYGLPWTSMGAKDRRTLLFLMTAMERQKLLSAGSFHIIGFKELKNIFSRVFSCVLLLNQVMKS